MPGSALLQMEFGKDSVRAGEWETGYDTIVHAEIGRRVGVPRAKS